ncbi:hypothetical protein KCU99_g1908, partial [Aureobasidium melanogenum]
MQRNEHTLRPLINHTDLKAMVSTLGSKPGNPAPVLISASIPPQSEPQITTDDGAALGDDEHESEDEIYTEDDESPEQDHAMHNMDDDKISDYEDVNGDVDMRTLNANQTNILTSLAARRSLNTHTTKKRHAIQQQTPASHGGAQGEVMLFMLGDVQKLGPINIAGNDYDNAVNEFLDQLDLSFFARTMRSGDPVRVF